MTAAAMTIFLVSLTGVPTPMAGFSASSTCSTRRLARATLLAVAGVLMSVISAAYYPGVVVAM